MKSEIKTMFISDTVVAFNFFRKFYVQEDEEGGDPDKKCHYMLTCFIYHFYAGVRAGGGIGDEVFYYFMPFCLQYCSERFFHTNA